MASNIATKLDDMTATRFAGTFTRCPSNPSGAVSPSARSRSDCSQPDAPCHGSLTRSMRLWASVESASMRNPLAYFGSYVVVPSIALCFRLVPQPDTNAATRQMNNILGMNLIAYVFCRAECAPARVLLRLSCRPTASSQSPLPVLRRRVRVSAWYCCFCRRGSGCRPSMRPAAGG